jgi:hypothetical protein
MASNSMDPRRQEALKAYRAVRLLHLPFIISTHTALQKMTQHENSSTSLKNRQLSRPTNNPLVLVHTGPP